MKKECNALQCNHTIFNYIYSNQNLVTFVTALHQNDQLLNIGVLHTYILKWVDLYGKSPGIWQIFSLFEVKIDLKQILPPEHLCSVGDVDKKENILRCHCNNRIKSSPAETRPSTRK